MYWSLSLLWSLSVAGAAAAQPVWTQTLQWPAAAKQHNCHALHKHPMLPARKRVCAQQISLSQKATCDFDFCKKQKQSTHIGTDLLAWTDLKNAMRSKHWSWCSVSEKPEVHRGLLFKKEARLMNRVYRADTYISLSAFVALSTEHILWCTNSLFKKMWALRFLSQEQLVSHSDTSIQFHWQVPAITGVLQIAATTKTYIISLSLILSHSDH